MTEGRVGRDEIVELLVSSLARVLAVPRDRVTMDARLDEDLHADSLDLLEVVESVEAGLASRGVRARVTEEALADLRTVADAVRRLEAAAQGEASA